VFLLYLSRLQKVETRNLQLAGTGERLIISNSYNRHNARSPVPARKNLLFAGDFFRVGFSVPVVPFEFLPVLPRLTVYQY
jgi:hypothetical protein